MIHIFLVDFNDAGDMFRVSIQGHKKAILSYLYSLSNDVRFVKSKDSRHKEDKGSRKLPCGIVTACSFEYCKFDTFSNYKSKYYDERKTVL